MDITIAYNKVKQDFENAQYKVNDTIRYQFLYNGFINDVFYTQKNGLEQSLRVIAKVNDIDYMFIEHFSFANDICEIKTYIDSELYKELKFSLFFVNGKCLTTPYFEKMRECIEKTHPLPKQDDNRNYYHHTDDEYKPFFETVVRKHMSNKMRKRIFDSYDKALATRILKFCGNTQTLRFTTDITKSKSIDVYFSSSQEINP